MASKETAQKLFDICNGCRYFPLTVEQEKQIIRDLNALRIILEDSYLVSQLKDYYENIWSDIHDQNDVDFMKQWSIEAYKYSYSQNKYKEE